MLDRSFVCRSSPCPLFTECVEGVFSEVRIAPVPFRKGALAPHVSLPDMTSGTHYGSPVDQTHRTGAAITFSEVVGASVELASPKTCR
jgi:hypothetical protein